MKNEENISQKPVEGKGEKFNHFMNRIFSKSYTMFVIGMFAGSAMYQFMYGTPRWQVGCLLATIGLCGLAVAYENYEGDGDDLPHDQD